MGLKYKIIKNCANCEHQGWFSYSGNLCHKPEGRELSLGDDWEKLKTSTHEDCPLNDFTKKAKFASQQIYEKLSSLEGEWVHDSTEFLPANVCCDHAGNVKFKKLLAEIIEKHFNN